MESVTEADLLAEILADYGEPIQPGDVTARMVRDAIGCDHATAMSILGKKVKAGRGRWVDVREAGRLIKAVRAISTAQPGT